MNRVIIAVGSNLNAKANIERAHELISKELTLLRESKLKETVAVDMPGAPDFLNGAFEIETALDMDGLKSFLKGIEGALGRDLTLRGLAHRVNESRTIDLDIIVFNGAVVNDDFERYAFVREAVIELAPDIKT